MMRREEGGSREGERKGRRREGRRKLGIKRHKDKLRKRK